jgi:hypothetical protein
LAGVFYRATISNALLLSAYPDCSRQTVPVRSNSD